MTLRKVLTAVLCALALGASPAFASSVTVASNNLTTFHSCVLSGVATTSTSVSDALVDQSKPTQTHGGGTSMTAESLSSKNQRSYVRFDLTSCAPAIPTSATVRTAIVRLFATAVPATCRTDDIFRVTATWSDAAITWNNQPFGTTVNNPSSGSATAQMSVGTLCLTNLAAGYVTGWNVTTDVAAFVAGSATNNGWMIRDDAENAAVAATATYSTHEAASAPHAPQLVIDYTT